MSGIIDAHQHFWHYNPTEYGWMGDDMGVLRRDHLPEDLKPLMRASGVTGTVAVQARRTLSETDWLLELAERHAFILGVVGWLDMASPDYEADLERRAENEALVGIRELIHDMPDPEFAVQDGHVKAVAALGRHGLAYDLLLRPQHLASAIRLVDMLPDQRFVVDHMAKPDLKRGRLDSWIRDMRELAQRPNVWCKVSGLVTEADWSDWTFEQLEPAIDASFEAFGTGRVMFGSDWPVATCAATYAGVAGLAVRYAQRLSEGERRAFLSGNCRQFYGLKRDGGEDDHNR